MKLPIYMDNHATTPMDPRVLEAMLPYLREEFGNAASRTHVFGWRAEAAVEKARSQIAELLGCTENELIFTSGATESSNLALKGVVDFYRDRGDHLVTVKTEHRAVLDVCRRLERARTERLNELQRLHLSELSGHDVTAANLHSLLERFPLSEDPRLQRWNDTFRTGAQVTYLDVGPDGRVASEAVEQAITSRTVLVSVMCANNEIGTLQPVDEIGKICRQKGVLFHCDAVQAVGKVPFHVENAQADLVSVSAHKIYGPKGIGALYVRRKPRVRLVPLIDGGGHERGLRSGTLNVPAIVGFGEAAAIARREILQESQRLLALRERLRGHLFSQLEGIVLNGSLQYRLPGNLNVSFSGVDGTALVRALKDVAVSSGSACTSASIEPSYVLRACKVEEALAQASIRFGLGRFNTEEEVDFVGRLVVEQVKRLRAERSALFSRHASGAGAQG